MRLLTKILILTGVVVLAFGFFLLGIGWVEPTGGYRTSYEPIFTTSIPVEPFETKTVEIELKNDTNYSFEFSTYLDEPLNASWIVLDPDGLEVNVFDLRQITHNTEQETVFRSIDARFNSTRSGNYSVLMTNLDGYSYSADFVINELTHLWMDQYKHFFNPAPMIASPFILIGLVLLVIGLIFKDSNAANQ
ncbi:MAG: hypothetical protein CW691_05030 [Candidatus Bathyarchaeum sp.]|nr:MAG: hypothetical protein CW691_05030 [Candidatus Bathyarchaeum sp.]